MADLIAILTIAILFPVSIALRLRVRAPQVQPPPRNPIMIENIILLVICTLLLVYLVYALLRPEKF